MKNRDTGERAGVGGGEWGKRGNIAENDVLDVVVLIICFIQCCFLLLFSFSILPSEDQLDL